MRTFSQRRIVYPALLLLFLFPVVFFSAGCSRSSRSVEKSSVTGQTAAPSTAQSTTTNTVVKEKVVETESPDGGLLSGTVHIAGEVLALPFRAVAGLFRVIF